MTEALGIAARKLVLDEMHRTSGAAMMERDGWSVPASYGDDLFEYAAIREHGIGLIDLSSRGRLVVTGSEAVAFLNGLITNDMKTLAENHWMQAVFPNVQGRLLASVRVIRGIDLQGSKGPQPAFMIDTEAATHERVLQTIQRFTLAGDFQVKDVTAETAMLFVGGDRAQETLEQVFGTPVSISAGVVTQLSWQGDQVTLLRASRLVAEGFDLIANNSIAENLWQTLVTAGARPVGYNAFEIMRVEAGVPVYGRDMDDTTVVTETNLDDAVSYTKGCYVGQEIIARIKYRGHVAKKLRGFVFASPATVATGTPIKSRDGKEIGSITSTTYSPILGSRIAIGYVKYDFMSLGTEVTIAGNRAQVSDLPFLNQLVSDGVEV
jgi:folate-binding protein YgfZ